MTGKIPLKPSGQYHQNKWSASSERVVNIGRIIQVTYNYSSKDIGATLEVHIDSSKGPVISSLVYQPTGDWNTYRKASSTVKDPGGKHDLYFVFKKEQQPDHDMFSLDWLNFKR